MGVKTLGKVVNMVDRLQSVSKKNIFGLRVLVTRVRASVHHLSNMLAKEGAKVVEIPTIKIKPLPLDPRGRKRLRQIGEYDWLVFSSSHAVEIFMKYLFQLRKAVRHMRGIKTACV